MKDQVEEYRQKLIEQISENDDALLEKFLDGVEPSLKELQLALRQATISYKLVPIYCGSSLRNKGVQPLLDAIVNYLPAPTDLPAVQGVKPKTDEKISRKLASSEPFSALAFKIQTDPHVGKLTYIRIYSGELKAGSYVYNSTSGKKERIGRLLLMHANNREQIDSASAGEIVAIIGLSHTKTGDTLCDESDQIMFEGIEFADPVISLAIEPKTKSDQERLGMALGRLAEEDPTFTIKSNQETGQTIISGMGELHLEILVDRLKREFKVSLLSSD
jgi:elongation factor G